MQSSVAEVASETVQPRFGLLLDLEVVEVTSHYNAGRALANFRSRYESRFRNFDRRLVDQNFSRPTTVIRPRDRLQVLIYQQLSEERTTSEDRIKFLQQEGCLLTGAQGIVFAYESLCAELPEGWLHSLDTIDRLWVDEDDGHRVPALWMRPDEDPDFRLDVYEVGGDKHELLLGLKYAT